MSLAPFRKILIANRGEIAVRVIQACRELDIRTVAIASEVDREAPHALLADEVHMIGGPVVTESYLNLPRIIEVAQHSGADAIHPGYGLFAEDAMAAKRIEEAGLVFIGPPPEVIARMGDKVEARHLARECQVPVAEGSDALSNLDRIRSAAADLGYPIIIKPVGGGGGIGMAIVYNEPSLENAVRSAQRLARASFNNPVVYAERYIPGARHIEIQIAADQAGNVIHLGERECSVQRRSQKLVEETPSLALDESLREAMANAAVRLAKTAGYKSMGTIEFLLAPDGSFFFMEMNTRIQVEHPITELVTGVDLVKEQLCIAGGQPLSVAQGEVDPRGHAIECRIYAEDFTRNFLPSLGTLTSFSIPTGPGVRVDTGVRLGSTITRYYDPLLCKVAVWERDRPGALTRMRRALEEFTIEGVKTTRELHLLLLDAPGFWEGRVHTRVLEDEWLPAFQGRMAKTAKGGTSSPVR